jgi:hypothetical protein
MRTSTRHGHTWEDGGWPLLAGLVSGSGIVASVTTLGPLATAGLFAAVAFVAAPSTWSILTESGQGELRQVARITLGIALVVLAAAGWISVADGWGVIPLVVVAATSPTVLRWTILRSRHTTEETRTRQEVDDLRREFDEIIRYGFSHQD